MQSIHSFTLLIKVKTKLLRIKARRRNVPFPQFWKSIKHPFGKISPPPPPPPAVSLGGKRENTLSSDPFWQKAQRDWAVCVQTCPHSSLLRAFLSPLSTGTRSPFQTYCPLLRPGEKRQMFPRLYQPVHYPVSCLKEEEKTPRGEKRPSPAFNHRTVLHRSKSVCTCSAGRAERAAPPPSAVAWPLTRCAVALAPFSGSSCLRLPEQIEVIQATSGA